MSEYFVRNELLLGTEITQSIANKTVLIAGLGGVGGYAAEATARLGFGTIILVDYDIVDASNINRQIIALTDTIGQKKTELFKQRINKINPEAKVIVYDTFIDQDHLMMFEDYSIDYVVDAIDTISSKILLMQKCLEKGIFIVSSMGMANRMDSTQVRCLPLHKTSGNPVAKKVRELARKANLDLKKIMTVCSNEIPTVAASKPLPSIILVPAAAGLACVEAILKEISQLQQ